MAQRKNVVRFSVIVLFAVGVFALAAGRGPSSTQEGGERRWPRIPLRGEKPLVDKFLLWLGQKPLRGASIWQRVRVPSLDGDLLGEGHIGPPYSQEDFFRLTQAGANWVNLSVPGVFTETAPYDLDCAALYHLDELVEKARRANLYVVISFRTGPGRSEFTFQRDGAGTLYPAELLREEVWTQWRAQSAWAEMWRFVAQRYRRHPAIAGYQLMTAPNGHELLHITEPRDFYPTFAGTSYDWNSLLPRLIQAIREVDEETPILVAPAGRATLSWLPYLQLPEVPLLVQ